MSEERIKLLESGLRAILYNQQVRWLREHSVNMARFDGIPDDLLERSYNHEIADIALDWDARQRSIKFWKDNGLFSDGDAG